MRQYIKTKLQLTTFVLGLFVLLITGFLVMANMTLSSIVGIKESSDSFYIKFGSAVGIAFHLLFYTNITNFFLGFMMLLLAYKPENEKVKTVFLSSVISITITFLVYWFLISWTQNWKNGFGVFTSLVTHAINPILGFIVLYLFRKEVKINLWSIIISSSIIVLYFFFALFLYLGTGAEYGFKNGAVVYKFLHFYRPFFVKTENIGLIVTLDILIFIIGALIPVILTFVWKLILNLGYKKVWKNKI
ncbi:membrane protein [Mycoplasmopsis canis UFG4]|uniref:Membrane protein n=1 Tax=Mycoplasmopsis canis UFG4 TaxID=1131455 RepID=I1A5F6_9BACT|nr:hypothetical protein [Mycoplasmopsis canis]EIE41727.1 membrane protein [Mycoplasmopsis canis UFG4]